MERDPFKAKAERGESEEWYRRWCVAHTFCMVCGIDARKAALFRFPGLSTHHMVKPGRVHISPNLLRTCARCHDLAENRPVSGWLNGVKMAWPRLTLGMCLTAKRRTEPADWEPERLERLLGMRLPDPEPLPMILDGEWNDRQLAVRGMELAWDFLQEINPLRRRACFLKR